MADQDPFEQLKSLTKREREVLRFHCHGYSYKEIALAIGRPIGTVKAHTAHVYEKLGFAKNASQKFRRRQLASIYCPTLARLETADIQPAPEPQEEVSLALIPRPTMDMVELDEGLLTTDQSGPGQAVI